MHTRSRLALLLIILAVTLTSVLGACGGGSTNGSGFTDGPDAALDSTLDAPVGHEGGPAADSAPPFGGDDDGGNGSPLTIDAIPPIQVDLDVNTGTKTVTPPQVTLQARLGGGAVSASWTIDRGELGALASATGAFVASGTAAGSATVTAQFAGQKATATLLVKIHATQNGGAPPNADAGAGTDAGAGGFGGVGGEGPGAAITDPTVRTHLQTDPATANASAATLQFLYPYDRTVWPRGLLAPLLQWQTDATHVADAVYVHLKEANYEFEGFYTLSGTAAARARQPIEAGAWKTATNANGGKTDPLLAEIKIYSSGMVYGPIQETWSVAQGVLQGTVYYNSYYTSLNTESSGVNVTQGYTGAVLSIQPRSPAPALTITSLYGHCNVCHSVAADGRTLFTQTDEHGGSGGDLDFGASYDLSNGGAVIQKYYSDNASGGTSNRGKFSFAAPYPDGTFVLANQGQNYHTSGSNSTLYSRDSGNEVLSAGFKDKVTGAVTPAFSPDGRKVAFSFWNGTGTAGVTSTGGHSIAVMDFDCGATAGQIQCGNATPTFSGLREIFGKTIDSNNNHFAGWPSFTPDGNALVFHHTLDKSGADFPLNTDHGAKGEIWYSDVPTAASGAASKPRLLCALNGYDAGCTTNPKRVIPDHVNGSTTYDDTQMNYEPNANPVSSGGYYWVIFTSRRRYGSVAAGDPYAGAEGQVPTGDPFTKKLWVAAIDTNPAPGDDPSHPAFYLPGQELRAGNMRGFWSVDPCHANGSTCETGEECCGGFCHDDGSGKLVCSDKPAGCSQEFDKCTTDADCCSASLKCVNGRCALSTPK